MRKVNHGACTRHPIFSHCHVAAGEGALTQQVHFMDASEDVHDIKSNTLKKGKHLGNTSLDIHFWNGFW
jgi:hypothetical protein